MSTSLAETGRRSALSGSMIKLGAVFAAVAAGGVLSASKAYADATPPGCYGYPGCNGGAGACGTSGTGGCCWYWTDPSQCRTYKCCDETTLAPNPCICRYLVGNFC